MVNIGQVAWDDLASLDPLWSILSVPTRKFSRWDLDEFFATGVREVSQLLVDAMAIGYPAKGTRVLDFGCGVGRVTRALAPQFDECYGVDVSGRMISLARQFNSNVANCRFFVNTSSRLELFPNDHFDLVYSNIVLQHIPRKRDIESYIEEFVRVLAPCGLLVFQLPNHIPLRHRIQLRARMYALMRRCAMNPRFLYARLRLHPIRMNFLPEDSVVSLIASRGGRLLRVMRSGGGKRSIQSCLYFVGKEPLSPWKLPAPVHLEEASGADGTESNALGVGSLRNAEWASRKNDQRGA
jgi:SAM-dependent methyltransferase